MMCGIIMAPSCCYCIAWYTCLIKPFVCLAVWSWMLRREHFLVYLKAQCLLPRKCIDMNIIFCSLTACGASCAYLLSKFSIANGEQAILFKYKFLRVRYEAFKNLVSKRLNPLHLFCYLIALRLFPASPNWMINILSPHLNIPLHVFSPSVFIGLLPFHYVTVSAGLVLATLTSPQEVISGQTIITMLLLAVLMCTIPPLLKKRTDMFNV